jgi:iron complex outermembrane receptor protein
VTGFSATAGVRYTSETVSSEQLPTSSYFDPPPPLQEYLQQKFNKVSWQFGLQEQLNPNTLLYVVSRRSFRSGGFNTVAPPIPGFGNEGGDAFDAETATDVEIGAKFQGTVATMPTRLNVAAYSERIDKVQRVVYTIIDGGPAGVTTNVPKAQVSGLEVDGQINPLNWLSLGTSFAYTDAKFTSNEVTIPGTPPVTVGFGPYADTPVWSGSVYSEARAPIGGNLQLSLRAELYDQTRTYFTSTFSTLTPGAELPGYAVANFRLSLDDSKAGWSVAANLKNAFNRVYYVGGLGSYNVFTTNAVIPGDPRTFVVTLRYDF